MLFCTHPSRREPLALINLKKKNEETGEEELSSRLEHCRARATRHIFLIRHSQYNLDGRADKDRTLTPLGTWVQAGHCAPHFGCGDEWMRAAGPAAQLSFGFCCQSFFTDPL